MEHASDHDVDLFEAFLTASDAGESKLLAELLGLDDVIVGAPGDRSFINPDLFFEGERRDTA